ncbi:MAG: ABC transporter ATP-binding protein [Burkholderiales bacterium]|nr:ABC transporter ATP-binding protein [Burkholderiales bacterium]
MTHPTAAAVVSFRGVHKRYASHDGGGTVALQDIHLDVAPGEFVTVVGPSGCGKSTLLRILAGIERLGEGEVWVEGARSAGPHPSIGVVFQAPVLLPWRNVLDNVLVPADIRRTPRARARQRALELLDMVGLADFATRYPAELSGGMQQRVGIARALINSPSLLLMDEPFGALDAMTREHMNLQLLALQARLGTTVMLVTHSIPEAVFLGRRVVVMTPRPGRITRVYDVALDAPRDLSVINTPRFGDYVAAIRADLQASGGLD